jgi:HK97 family phage major capsid protein
VNDFVKSYGSGVKAVGDYVVRGRGIVYGGKDLTGDVFTKATDLGDTRSFVGTPVYYDHGLGSIRGQIGTVKMWTPTDDGIDVEIELDKRLGYIGDVMALVKSGALGLSTGALSHLVVRQAGELKRWVVGEISLTPTPAEPRTLTEVKATQNDTVRTATATLSPSDTTSTNNTKGTTVENINQIVKDAVVDALKSVAGEPVNGGTYSPSPAPESTPATKSVALDNDTDPFASRDYQRAYKSYVRGTADNSELNVLSNAKSHAFKTLNEGTNNDGGFTVPTTINREIIARRDDMSLLGAFAFTRITTESWKHIMPAQSTKATAGIVTEGTTATASEPNFANSKTIQLYKDTLEFAVTDELLADSSSNLEQFMQVEIARAMAVSSNSYIILGTGSGQPYGLNARVTNSVALSASAITNAQVISVSTAVNGSYLQNGQTGWIMKNATWGALRTLDLTNYNRITAIEAGIRYAEGWRVALSESVAAIGTGNKSLWFGNFNYYAFCERTSGVQIDRWRDVRKGLTYIVASWRYGGDVTQPEAFAVGTHA